MANRKLTFVLFGSTSAVHFTTENVLLGEDRADSGNVDVSQIVPVSRIVWGWGMSVINLLGLQESNLPQHTVDRFITDLVDQNEIHAFINVLCQLTDSAEAGLDWLERTLGGRAPHPVMTLLTYESQEECDTIVDDLNRSPALERLVERCGGWYHTCRKGMDNQSEMRTLLEKIEKMASGHGPSSSLLRSPEVLLRPSGVVNDLQLKEPDINDDQPKELKVISLGLEASAQGDRRRRLLARLLGNPGRALTFEEASQIQRPCSDPVSTFLQRLLAMNYKAREAPATRDDISPSVEEADEESFSMFLEATPPTSPRPRDAACPVHPEDVQAAALYRSDAFLRQVLVTKLSQCQLALPLLVPDPLMGDIEFSLWSFRQIQKSWVAGGTDRTAAVTGAETPMVAFLRFGTASVSKSDLINRLINEKHHTFLHRDSPGCGGTRVLAEGAVEVAWYCPSGGGGDRFRECVAFCNLRGDAEENPRQAAILMGTATAVVALLPDQESTRNKAALRELFQDSRPFVCLLCNSNEPVVYNKKMKFKIGLRGRNQADVDGDLGTAIELCLSTSPSTFKLEDLGRSTGIKVDERDEECQRGKAAAAQITDMLSAGDVSGLEETHLPCRGRLWHAWSQKNKDLHRLHGADAEARAAQTRREMKKIRKEQCSRGTSDLMEAFISTLGSSDVSGKKYFLRWLTIMLDSLTPDESTQTTESVFGLEHILREMGQIYESSGVKGSQEEGLPRLPEFAAEILLFGYPLELLDGDAGHVPLIWVSAVLDELIKKLGDQRVFVLSVLGVQSSGKSTMLNAMFGLQFAVSAGRCTRGAFMQLVGVSEEMREELKFDHVLVVDTEGLRALELDGKTVMHHDNELATFVVGLGNVTIINIYGENPAEMQDVLQIVVQAILRMKRVRLSPSCVFVHQNVPDITTLKKTMKEREHLREKLDKMTRLAAKEEESDAECFSDIIEFDAQSDIKYFPLLWEGNPPMAPPNPSYSEHILSLRELLFSKASAKRLMRLSQFKSHFANLWGALLNENFVFSFKNTLEITAYRELENEYCKWTWSLRSAMLVAENKLYNRVSNDWSAKVDEVDIVGYVNDTKLEVDKSIQSFFDGDQDKEILIQWKERFVLKVKYIYRELVEGTRRKLNEVISLKTAREKVDREKSRREKMLYNQSKNLALSLKSKEISEDALKNNFEDIWSKCVKDLNQDSPSVADIDVWGDAMKILMESYEPGFIFHRQNQAAHKRIDTLGNYSEYIISKKKPEPGQRDLQSTEAHVEEDDDCSGALAEEQSRSRGFSSEENKALRELTGSIIKGAEEEIKSKPIAEHGYSQIYIPEIITSIKEKVKAHQSQTSRYLLRKEFTVDLCLHVCSFAAERFGKLHDTFKEATDIMAYLEKQKLQYFRMFKNYCSGATSTTVFGEFMVDRLKPSILQAAYDKTALDVTEKMKRDILAFRGNRSNLEKHILTSLAEQEDFENYKAYLHTPKEYFTKFITEEVNRYLFEENTTEVLEALKRNIKSVIKFVMDSVKKVTEDVTDNDGDVNMWLQLLSTELKDELQFKAESCLEQKEITDLHFLQEIINNHLPNIRSELCNRFLHGSDLKLEMFRKKPDQTMMEHLCRCCWAQCPFCSAICTNTLEDHSGDHDVRFHRNCGINGWSLMFSNTLGLECCTTAVSIDTLHFSTVDKVFKFKEYRKAGGEYAKWNICRDDSEMPYWKWFVCRFQKNLEDHYKKPFQEIPQEWRQITKDGAIRSLQDL